MFNTHGLVKDICDHFRNDPDRYADLKLYVSMPYAHKYASAVADKGIFGALKDTIISDSSASDIVSMLTRGDSRCLKRICSGWRKSLWILK